MTQNSKEEKQTYEDKLCRYCKNKHNCPKDKIIINHVSEKTSSILCYSYDYENM